MGRDVGMRLVTVWTVANGDDDDHDDEDDGDDDDGNDENYGDGDGDGDVDADDEGEDEDEPSDQTFCHRPRHAENLGCSCPSRNNVHVRSAGTEHPCLNRPNVHGANSQKFCVAAGVRTTIKHQSIYETMFQISGLQWRV